MMTIAAIALGMVILAGVIITYCKFRSYGRSGSCSKPSNGDVWVKDAVDRHLKCTNFACPGPRSVEKY